MSKAEHRAPGATRCTRSLTDERLDRPALDVWNAFTQFIEELRMCGGIIYTCVWGCGGMWAWVCVCVSLRMWPQVDVVFWHKAFPVVELSCVPVRIIFHVGDLGTNIHRRVNTWNAAGKEVGANLKCNSILFSMSVFHTKSLSAFKMHCNRIHSNLVAMLPRSMKHP